MRLLATLYLIAFSFILTAQQKKGDVAPMQTIEGQEAWSVNTKINLIYVFAAIVLILVFRTFRNSSDA